jgi:hypothetical protein
MMQAGCAAHTWRLLLLHPSIHNPYILLHSWLLPSQPHEPPCLDSKAVAALPQSGPCGGRVRSITGSDCLRGCRCRYIYNNTLSRSVPASWSALKSLSSTWWVGCVGLNGRHPILGAMGAIIHSSSIAWTH